MKYVLFNRQNCWSNGFGLARVLSAVFLVLLISNLSCNKANENVLKVGDKAPNFEATDIRGNLVSSQKAAGKPMILRFFDPDCKYCRADTAVFNTYHTKYKDKGLQVIYFNTESDPKLHDVEKFIKELGIEFPVVLDSGRKTADLFRVQVVPQTILLDPQHVILGAILGGVSEAELDDMLKPFL